jgi:ABC-type uncharacterized transport system substrate-binding protein
MKKGLFSLTLFWVSLVLLPSAGMAQIPSVLFLTADDSPLLSRFLHSEGLNPAPSIRLEHPMRWRDIVMRGFMGAGNGDLRAQGHGFSQAQGGLFPALCERVAVVVALGREAARAALQGCGTPTLAIFVTRLEWDALLAATTRKNIAALYLEADPVLNLRLIRLLLPKAITVGLFVSPQSQAWLPRLREEAHRLRLQLTEIPVTEDEEAVQVLRHHILEMDALLLLPETRLINAWSLKPMLLMSARHGIPTIGGITANYVRAGVMAAVVADLEALARQVTVLMVGLAQGEAMASAYPQAIDVTVNEVVASHLVIDRPDHDQLIQGLQALSDRHDDVP